MNLLSSFPLVFLISDMVHQDPSPLIPSSTDRLNTDSYCISLASTSCLSIPESRTPHPSGSLFSLKVFKFLLTLVEG